MRSFRSGSGAQALTVLALLSACGSPPPAEEPRDSEPAATPEPAPTTKAALDPADLSKPDRREAAVLRFIEEYDVVAQNGTKTEPALAFVTRYGEPLVQAYIAGHGSLSPKTQLSLLNALVSFEDPITVPALALALESYASTGQGVDEAIWACQAAKHLKSERLAAALLKAFEAVDTSDKHGGRFSTHLEQAMLFNALPAWSGTLKAKLEAPIVRPERFDDKPAVREFSNRRFWQITAAKILGEQGDASAARPLLKVVLDRHKKDVHPAAVEALKKLGQPSADLAHALLSGTDKELVALSKETHPTAAEPHLLAAATIIGELVHPSSREPVSAALKKTRDPAAKAALEQALGKLP